MTSLIIDPTQYSDPIVDKVNGFLPTIPGVIFGLVIAALFVRLSVRLLRLALRFTHIQQGLKGILVSVAEIFLWLLVIIKTLESLGFSGIVTFFSSSALAIGILLAAGGSTLLADIVAGIFLAQDNDFGVGDEVVAGETATRGIVESMDARRIRIRDSDGILHVLPNAVVERKEWILIKKNDTPNPLVRAVRTATKLRTTRRTGARDKRLDTAPDPKE